MTKIVNFITSYLIISLLLYVFHNGLFEDSITIYQSLSMIGLIVIIGLSLMFISFCVLLPVYLLKLPKVKNNDIDNVAK